MNPERRQATEDPYWPLIVAEAPRTLGLIDRDPLSRTAGCADRTFWAWKFTDFAGTRFQEAVCVLAYLHADATPGNPYTRSDALRGWIELALRYWGRRQHADGSHDEAYPHERSLAATAFGAFYVAESLGFLADSLSAEARREIVDVLRRSGTWLIENDERHGVLSNHLAAAAAALEHVHVLTGEERFRRRREYFVDRILSRQSAEGWYEEYGGADPGYQTHGTFYLARIWQLTHDTRLLDSLRASTRFLAHCIHPDGSLGGEYTSRNTQTYYPAAFEMLAPVDPTAAWIADAMRPGVTSGAAAGQRSVDAYNYFPLLNNLVFAREAFRVDGRSTSSSNPVSGHGTVHFADAGIVRLDRPGAVILIGTSKGGVVKVFDRGRLVASDCGLVGALDHQRQCSTQYLDRTRPVQVSAERITVRGRVVECTRPVMSPLRFLVFRVGMMTVGRVPAVARWVKDLLVRVLIDRRTVLEVEHERTIRFDEDALVIDDRLQGADLQRFTGLWRGALFTTVHMGSSRYFVPHELAVVDANSGLDPLVMEPGMTEVRSQRRIPLGR